MATTPPRVTRSRTQPPPATPPSEKRRLHGLYREGKWWCNCEPRQEAVLREVSKKGSRNIGKFFWKCQVYPYCDFFLWEDAAKRRQQAQAQTSEPEDDTEELVARPKTPTSTQTRLTSFGYQVTPGGREGSRRSGMDTPPASASKRKSDSFEDVFSDLDSDDERQLADLADESAKKMRVNEGTGSLRTPANARSADMIGGLPTPSTTRTLFPDSSKKRTKSVSFEVAPPLSFDKSTSTPNTTTTSRSSATLPLSTPPEANDDPTEEIMRVLRSKGLDAASLKNIEELLAKSSRRAKGIAMGRDHARNALREKDLKIAKMQEKITAMENKEKMMQNQVTHIKADMMRWYQDMQ